MKEKSELIIKYIFADDYNPVYVSGAHGGVTARGEIVANFFLERHALPISQTYQILNENSIGEEIKREPKDLKSSVVRFVHQGIILNLQNAKILNSWLNDRIEELEKYSSNDKEIEKNENLS